MTTRSLHATLLASASVLILSVVAPAVAQQRAAVPAPQQDAAPTTALDDITVTATRTEDKVVNTMAGVSVRSRDDIQKQAPQRIGSVISGMPGVTTQENPNDPATAINIRGLQDFGRVAVTVDGARQNFQRSGHNANGAFFLDPAFIRSIDVTRGPVANIYGSGAIGGVASFETVDPKDILRPGEWVGGQFGLTGLAGRQGGLYGHGIAAIRPWDWASGLFGLSFRNTDDYKNGAGAKIADSGQELISGLGKIVLTPGEGHTIKLSGQIQKYEFANGIGSSTSPRRANDVATTNFVGKYNFRRPGNDWLDFNISAYRTTTDTDQRRISGTAAQIGQARYFKVETIGVDLNNTSRFEVGPVKMAFTFGLDAFRDQVRTSDPASNGDETTPSGRRTVAGGFIQNRATWGMLDLIAGLRYDHYELSNGVISSDGQRVSPKITLGITPIAGLQPYVTYAEGYRAPSVTETLVNGLHPVPASFIFIPNPALKPEVGKTIEAGLNIKYDDVFAKGDKVRGKISVFQNDVTNFIEGVYSDPGAPCGAPIPGACSDATYTYKNIYRARLKGIEGEFAYDTKFWYASLSGSSVRGDNRTNGQPLESVYPDRVSFAAGVRLLDEKLSIGGRVTYVAAQRRLPTTALATASKAYTLVDASISYDFNKDARLFVMAENLGDVRYKRYRDGDYSPGMVAKFGLTMRLGQ